MSKYIVFSLAVVIYWYDADRATNVRSLDWFKSPRSWVCI